MLLGDEGGQEGGGEGGTCRTQAMSASMAAFLVDLGKG